MVTSEVSRVPRRLWVGLVAVAVYVALAGLGSNLLILLLAPSSATAEFALGHLVSLPILVVAGIWFARWSGWWSDVWSESSALRQDPRRRWMILIPVLLAAQTALLLVQTPWAERAAGFLAVALVATALVGLGEELYFRGILLTAVRERHGELAALVITSLLFGLGHSVGSIVNGIPLGGIAFQVAFTALAGTLYYGARRATGTLWVPVVLHSLNDFGLYAQSAESTAARGHAVEENDLFVVWSQFALIVLSLVLVISTAREDRRRRRARQPGRSLSEGPDRL